MLRNEFSLSGAALLLGLAAAVFVLPIPHTVAARLLLLVLLAAATITTWPELLGRFWQGELRPALVALLALTGWIIAVNLGFALHPAASWQEFASDWPRFLILLVLGAGLAERGKQQHVLMVILVALVLHWFWLFVYEGWLAWQGAGGVLGHTPFGERDFHSTLVTFGLVLPIADLLTRRFGGERLFPGREIFSWALLALGLAATIILRTRNGTATVALMLAAASLFWASRYFKTRRQFWIACTGGVLLALFMMAMSFATDQRWRGFADAISFALDTEGHRYWLTITDEQTAMPTLPSGEKVEESAYMRIAWAKVALQLIGEHPFGVGFGHRAFGWAIEAHYGVGGNMVSSHSGLLDFTLANGIPGVVLWIVANGLLIRAGVRRYLREGQAAGLALALFVLGNLIRCAVDGHISGWRFELFALVTGVLLWAPRTGRAVR